MKISVIIVSFNTAEFISECIESLLVQMGVTLEIIVVDNASKDNSVEILKSYKDKICLLINPENVGFGKACNQAFNGVTGEYIYLLNPDMKLTNSNDLQNLLDYALCNPESGFVGTKIKANTNTYDFISKLYPGQKNINQSLGNLPGEIAYLPCASALIPKQAFEKINGFDEDFFMYGEHFDLCLRLRKVGYKIDFFSQIIVEHVDKRPRLKIGNYQKYLRRMQSLYTFYRKHYFIDEVKNLLKKDLLKARCRLFILWLNKCVLPNSYKLNDRIEHYQAIKKVAIENLKNF